MPFQLISIVAVVVGGGGGGGLVKNWKVPNNRKSRNITQRLMHKTLLVICKCQNGKLKLALMLYFA